MTAIARGAGGTVLRGAEYLEPGFPLETTTFREHQALLGDVDGDGRAEIVAITLDGIAIVSETGSIESTVDRSRIGGAIGATNYPFLALADVDANGVVDILFQQRGIHATDAFGTELAGFPVDGEIFFAVGDVIGGDAQEVVSFRNAITTPSISPVVHLVMYQADGSPIDIEVTIDEVGDPGSVMPTIADIDLDGRNEVIVTGDHWNGIARDYYKIWVFDFGGAATNGTVEWGQKFGDRRNSGAHSTARD